MPKIFVKLDINFELQDLKNNNFLNENYKINDNYNLYISVRSETNSALNIALEIGNDNIEDGTFAHKLKESSLEISCQGSFKINVKESYISDVLDDKALWLFNSFGSYGQGLTRLEIKDGLRKEEFEYRKMGETFIGIRYPLNVKTDKAKKNL
jgi:hypothetical protein|tara:strand:+ start:428 stop:886 length:459 start_codon:yes stop_codon:yes gene_type:complete